MQINNLLYLRKGKMSKSLNKTLSKYDKQQLKQKYHVHDFTEDEITSIRGKLLAWYDTNKRDLPWRHFASEKDPNVRAYAVWVSEVMLQQTQVATVIDYYNRWMEKWPTLGDLTKANLEEVNECWSGLGYYSRSRRLHEGARKVVEDLGGAMPTSAAKLKKELPGVGRYTAGAVASIAFSESTGVVDGNVIRVLSRLRTIGADISSNVAIDKFWELANSLVAEDRPGDFNQAMMEFGATLCTPKTPQCSTCVLNEHCWSFKQVEQNRVKCAERLTAQSGSSNGTNSVDIEDCMLCLPATESWDSNLGVCNYPVKPKKKAAKEETFIVIIVESTNSQDEHKFLIAKRPQTGLLAGMWELPNTEIHPNQPNSSILKFLKDELGLEELEKGTREIGEVAHKFSHRNHKYTIKHCVCKSVKSEAKNVIAPNGQIIRWVSRKEFEDAAISSGMRKVFKFYNSSLEVGVKGKAGGKKRKRAENDSTHKQLMLDAFFFKPKKL